METVVGERGVRLSGGQRQRIAIARALYLDPQVLVLDEATSSLDTDTEREVMAAVEALHGTKTLIIVAHRLSTVAKCDVLHRVEAGRIVRSGTFADVVPQ
jgi:ABC-type bacteriocin/lantibiotic exporter with double-glycine peptidase domain